MRALYVRSPIFLAALFPLAFLLLGTPVVRAQDETVLVRWENTLLSVYARDVPRSRVLEEVSRTTGLEFKGLDTLRDRVSVSITDSPLQQAVSILLGDLNFLFVPGSASPQQAPRGVVLILAQDRPLVPPQGSPSETRIGFDEALALLRKSPDPNERLRMTEDWLTQGAEPSKIEEILQTAVSDPEALVRELALRQLRDRNAELWRKTFLEHLKSADVDRRRTATQLLAESPEEDSLELLREATEDENIDVRFSAFQNLAHLAEQGGLEILRERLAHPDPEVRLLALETLASKGGELALEAARFGLNDSDEAVQARAEGIISELGVQ